MHICKILHIQTYTCTFGRRLGKGCRRENVFTVHHFPRIFSMCIYNLLKNIKADYDPQPKTDYNVLNNMAFCEGE